MNDLLTIICGDALEKLREMPSESVQCCVTSPPFWGLRDYGCEDQLGLEKTPEEYVAKLVEVFREVRRVLRKDGTLWLNLGDSYASGKGTCYNPGGNTSSFNVHLKANNVHPLDRGNKSTLAAIGLKPKDLVGIPWLVAFALRDDGWYLRDEIIWNKPNPMPESVTDRCTKSHEKIFLLTESARYFFDNEAIKEPYAASTLTEFEQEYNGKARKDYDSSGAQNPSDVKRRITDKQRGHSRRHAGFNDRWDSMPKIAQQINGANKRSVWTVATAPYPEAHFATYPPDLIKPCILAGSKHGETVLDPFAGSGTTGMVALELGRKAILIELNPKYIELIRQRCDVTAGLALPV
jgi:DNA modification methylase